MKHGLRGAGMRLTAFAALTVVALVPCLAGPAIPVPGIGTLQIEAIGSDRATPGGEARALVWTLTGAEGVRSGIVPATAGPEPDASPVLAADPRTGAPVLIWSRWDGQAMKLAWSRFDDGIWSAARDVTFGPGDDRSPAVGISSAGAYLFFWRNHVRVLYAPIDLGTGRLFAAPAPLSPAVLNGRDMTPHGGTDVPVLGGGCGPTHVAPCVSPGPPVVPTSAHPGPTIEGGTDTPILHDGSTSASQTTALSVASEPGCRTMIVGLARRGEGTHRIVAFDGAGRSWVVGRIKADIDSTIEALSATTSRYLDTVCR